jgi:hypothetical protein
MAKPTKAERAAAEEANRYAAFEKLATEWTARVALMMVEYANLPSFSICSTDDNPLVFVFSPPNHDQSNGYVGYNHHYKVPLTLTYETFYNALSELENAEYAVTRYNEAEEESRRKAEAFREAVAKLNPDEVAMLKAAWAR